MYMSRRSRRFCATGWLPSRTAQGRWSNGDRLVVLEHGRRFFRVQTEKGEQGWIDEKAVATQDVFDAFQALGQEHKDDPAVASAVVRDEVNLHLKPGRETERFYRLVEGDKVQLLARATLPKPVPGTAQRRRLQRSRVEREDRSARCGGRSERHDCAADCDGRLVAGARCAWTHGLAALADAGCGCA